MLPWRALAGALCAGYGLLVVSGALAHDGLAGGILALGAGVVLLAGVAPPLRARRARVVGGAGLLLVLGVLGYNALRGSDLAPVEGGMLAYGAVLCAAAPFLDRRIGGRVAVGEAVGWSLPLLAVPLVLVALNGVLADRDPGAAQPVLETLLARPVVASLQLTGHAAALDHGNVVMATPRGTLSLGIGMVCAGLYPMVAFLGVLGLHGWRARLPPPRLAALAALGLLGLWLANLLRLVVLARVGSAWGAGALQLAHEHAGWVLFLGFTLLFWGLMLPRERRQPTSPGAPSAAR